MIVLTYLVGVALTALGAGVWTGWRQRSALHPDALWVALAWPLFVVALVGACVAAVGWWVGRRAWSVSAGAWERRRRRREEVG